MRNAIHRWATQTFWFGADVPGFCSLVPVSWAGVQWGGRVAWCARQVGRQSLLLLCRSKDVLHVDGWHLLQSTRLAPAQEQWWLPSCLPGSLCCSTFCWTPAWDFWRTVWDGAMESRSIQAKVGLVITLFIVNQSERDTCPVLCAHTHYNYNVARVSEASSFCHFVLFLAYTFLKELSFLVSQVQVTKQCMIPR